MTVLKKLRNKKNLSQEAVALRMNVSVATVSRWETGEMKPRADKLPALAKLFGCTIDELLKQE